jgi:hypothetical protein
MACVNSDILPSEIPSLLAGFQVSCSPQFAENEFVQYDSILKSMNLLLKDLSTLITEVSWREIGMINGCT